MVLNRFRPILQQLADRDVEFIVVGGMAAVFQAAPITTFDIDVVHSTSAENVARLLRALGEVDAYYRLQPERRFRPNESHLSGPGHQLLMTRFGPLDLLGTIGKARGYGDLLPHTIEMEITDGLRVRVLQLDALIATKEEAGREKDLAVLPILRATLEEIRKRDAGLSTTSSCG